MPSVIFPSFAKGELAPSLWGRVDTAAYQVSLRTARNVIIHSYGGASNRPGQLFVGPLGDHTLTSRLFRFQFRTTDQYVLVFQNLTMRVIRNDAFVLNSAATINAATQANPVVITTVANHNWSNGDNIFITGVVGMTRLNNRFFTVANKANKTAELTHQVTGDNINSFGFDAYSSAGAAGSVFELTTPYLTADLPNLKIVQSGDILTLTHRAYATRDLARTDHNVWTLTVNTYAPTQVAPTGVTVAVQGATGAVTLRYKVTAITNEEDGFEESLSGLSTTTVTISSATLTNPVRCVVASDVFITNDEIEVNAMDEMTALNGRRFFVTRVDATHIDLNGEDGTDSDIYPNAETTGGLANRVHEKVTNAVAEDTASFTNFNRITWTAASGAGRYAIYKQEPNIGRFGLIGEVDAPQTTFDDVTAASLLVGTTHAPDLTVQPPRARNPFLFAGTFPGTSGYYQQRQNYGGSTNFPDSSFYSQTGNRLNMSISVPTQADDAITTKFDAIKFNEIRHFVPLTNLLVFTSSSEWMVTAGDNSGFSADTLLQKPQSDWGCSHQQPIVIGETVLFVEDGGARIRGFGYSLEKDKYLGSDLSLLANHLLAEEGPAKFIVTDWSYSSVPESRIYIVRSDGQLLTMTYDQTQQVIAWTHWDTDGTYEATTSLKRSISGVEDGIYFVVQRTINGSTVRYVERLATRKFADVRDAFFVDCGLTLDNPLPISATTAAEPIVVTTSASHGLSNNNDVDIEGIVWDPTFDSNLNEIQPDQLNDNRFRIFEKTNDTFKLAETQSKNMAGATVANPVVITSYAHDFSDDDVVYITDVVGMTSLNNLSFTVANATTDTFELQSVDGSGYSAWTGGGEIRLVPDGTAFRAYVKNGNARLVVTTITGLDHIEARDAQIVVDGSPLPSVSVADATTAVPTTVVVDGSISLPVGGSRIHIGLRYIADWETLNVESDTGTIQGKKQTVSEVTIRFYKSRLPLIGPNKNNLIPMAQRTDEKMGLPTALLTDDKEVVIPPDWNSNGRIFFRQEQPLPTTILAIIPNMDTEDSEKEED